MNYKNIDIEFINYCYKDDTLLFYVKFKKIETILFFNGTFFTFKNYNDFVNKNYTELTNEELSIKDIRWYFDDGSYYLHFDNDSILNIERTPEGYGELAQKIFFLKQGDDYYIDTYEAMLDTEIMTINDFYDYDQNKYNQNKNV